LTSPIVRFVRSQSFRYSPDWPIPFDLFQLLTSPAPSSFRVYINVVIPFPSNRRGCVNFLMIFFFFFVRAAFFPLSAPSNSPHLHDAFTLFKWRGREEWKNGATKQIQNKTKQNRNDINKSDLLQLLPGASQSSPWFHQLADENVAALLFILMIYSQWFFSALSFPFLLFFVLFCFVLLFLSCCCCLC